ncbi:MAG: hypothetical protein JWQ35_992 [Bacteriovoracaceae bacterium]|nr:hypothetical protein [Bacteriovoracaceae bacterium]
MPTLKKRIQIPVEDKVYKELEKLASKREISMSSLAMSLVEEALELQEDIYFSRIADERLSKLDESKLISHKDAWK